jgi:hypothetical protein
MSENMEIRDGHLIGSWRRTVNSAIQVVFVGVTAKTAFCWYDSFLDDLEGKRIAEMPKMIRVMKSSSSLYQ